MKLDTNRRKIILSAIDDYSARLGFEALDVATDYLAHLANCDRETNDCSHRCNNMEPREVLIVIHNILNQGDEMSIL